MAINNPSIIELTDKIDSKYTLCVTAAKRARQLIANEAQPLIAINENETLKPLKIAVHEINQNLITFAKSNSKDE